MGIKVLPPDVGESIRYFAAVGEDIRFGLGAVRNVGTNVVDSIVAARQDAAFESFHDFLDEGSRARREQAHGRIAHQGRRLRLARLDAPRAHGDPRGRDRGGRRGQAQGGDRRDRLRLRQPVRRDRGAAPGARCPIGRSGRRRTSWRSSARCSGSTSRTTRSRASRSRWPSTRRSASTTCSPRRISSDGDQVTVAGLVTSVQHRVAKSSGNPYGLITVEDFDGEVTVMFMGKTYTEFQSMLQADSILVVRGRISRRDDGLNLHAVSAFTPDLGCDGRVGPARARDARAARERGDRSKSCSRRWSGTRATPRSRSSCTRARSRRSSRCRIRCG